MEGPCISCGFPLEEAKKHGADNPGHDWCTYCAAEDGSLKSWDAVVEGYTQFVIQTEKLEPEAARTKVIEGLKQQPAWQGRAE